MARPVYLKAITAFVSAFAVPFVGALNESSDAGSAVTSGEWITALVAGAATGVAVYLARNGVSTDPTTSTPEIDTKSA